MENITGRIKHITKELREYIETRLELTMLTIGDKITLMIGKSIQQLAGYAILGIGLVFALAALAIFLGEVMGTMWAGFAVVAAPFVVFGWYFVAAGPGAMATRIQEEILSELLDSIQEEKMEQEFPKQLPEREQTKAGK